MSTYSEFTVNLRFLFIFILMFAFTGQANAWCRTVISDVPTQDCQDDGKATPLYWTNFCLKYFFNEDFFDDLPLLTENKVRDIFQESFETWENIKCIPEQEDEPSYRIPFYFEQMQNTTKVKSAEYILESQEENKNIIYAISAKEWRDAGDPAGTYAFTYVWYNSETGEILDTDMVFNLGRGPYTDCDQGCESGEVDLKNTATHEAGHVVGLAHSDVKEATMYGNAIAGETKKRDLDDDDIQGLCASYPADSVEPHECVGEAPGCECPKFQVMTETKTTKTVCACNTLGALNSPPATRLMAYLFLLSLFLLARYRLRRGF